MDLYETIILGVVEGFTEFLPVSSTAHLILTSKLLRLESSNFLKSFEVAIQLGAIASVISLYWKTLISRWDLKKKILVAFVPTAVVGLFFYGLIKNILFENYMISVYSLLIGGVLLVLFELFHEEKNDKDGDLLDITYTKALAIGAFQSISIVPGVSRAAATILGGMLLGIRRKTIVEFSFLLAIPTMAAATGLDLLKSADSFSRSDSVNLALGFVISFVVATLSIKCLLKFIQNHNFISFGIYRIMVAIIFLTILN